MSLLENLCLLCLISLDSLSSLIGSLKLINSHLIEFDLLLLGQTLDLSHVGTIDNSTLWELVGSIRVINEPSELVNLLVPCLSEGLSVTLSLSLGHIESVGHLLSFNLIGDCNNVGIFQELFALSNVVELLGRASLVGHLRDVTTFTCFGEIVGIDIASLLFKVNCLSVVNKCKNCERFVHNCCKI